ncbi:apolipoprotein N-acyltransferase [Draconibacterium sp.]|jgi:apolipoprotein N-acyltransferase
MGKTKINTALLFVLPVLTGIVLGLSALPSKLYYLNFIAFIPLLIAAEGSLKKHKSFLIFVLQLLITLVTFYSIVYFWVLQTANMGFAIGYFIVLPFVIFLSPYIVSRKRGSNFSALYFIAAWLTVEMIQSFYQLGSPFYNLGNNLGANPKIIQWYEFTGAAGGTLWILAVNFLIFSLGKTMVHGHKNLIKQAVVLVCVLVAPTVVSVLIFNTYKEKGTIAEVLIIHPSTDNQDIKYRINIYELMDIYLDIMQPQLSENTEYVVLPETAITNAGWISEYNRNLVFQHFREKTAQFPNLKLITGAVTYEAIPNVEKIKNYKKIPGIRYSEKYRTWYYTYNAALQIEQNQATQIRVKEGLVPYQEFAPYPTVLPYISPVGIDFQFSKRKKNREVFIAESGTKTAAMICYEVVLGNLFYKAVRKGAEAFFVLLNEGWYNDPKVPRQFLQLSVVRAIENRRSVAHSSNMGVSAFINQRGEVIASTESKQPDFLKREISLNRKKTIYTTLGNYLSIVAVISMVAILVNGFLKKKVSSLKSSKFR